MSVRARVILALTIFTAWYRLFIFWTDFRTLTFSVQLFMRGGAPCFPVVAGSTYIHFHRSTRTIANGSIPVSRSFTPRLRGGDLDFFRDTKMYGLIYRVEEEGFEMGNQK